MIVSAKGEAVWHKGGKNILHRLGSVSLTAALIVVLDQSSKYLALRLLDDRGIVSLFNDCLRFLLVENPGGFLSLGTSLPDGVRSFVFLLLSSVFLFAFLIFTLFDDKSPAAVLRASAMIIGGGIGNLIDRGFRDGVVIDFVNVGIGSLRTGIFNIADMAVLLGCLLLVYFLPVKKRAMEAKSGDRTG